MLLTEKAFNQIFKNIAKAIAEINAIFFRWLYTVFIIKVLNIVSDFCEFKVYSVILIWLGIYKLLQLNPPGNVADIIAYAGILYTFISFFMREIQKPGSHVFLLLLNLAPWSKAQINIPPEFFRKPRNDDTESSNGEIKENGVK